MKKKPAAQLPQQPETRPFIVSKEGCYIHVVHEKLSISCYINPQTLRAIVKDWQEIERFSSRETELTPVMGIRR